MCNEHRELITILHEEVNATQVERERLNRAQAEIALAMVKMTRHAEALLAEVEGVKNRLAGITRYGDQA